VESGVHFCCNEKAVGTLESGRGLKKLWGSKHYNSMRLAAWKQDAKAVKKFVDSDCASCLHSDQKMQIMSLLGAAISK